MIRKRLAMKHPQICDEEDNWAKKLLFVITAKRGKTVARSTLKAKRAEDNE